MTKQAATSAAAASPSAAELIAIATTVEQQIAALPEAEILAHFAEQLAQPGFKAVVSAAGALAKALPPGVSLVGDYTVGLINTVGALNQAITNRLAELKAAADAARLAAA